MRRSVALVCPAVCCTLLSLAAGRVSAAGLPTVAEALKLTPIQGHVDYETPTADELSKCRIEAEQGKNRSGWAVRGPAGQLLRRFVDTNGDEKVDQWCYFKDGIEVYRDIDANHNRKADQYRWLGTAGVRWGLDPDEDGVIDSWKDISAEEVSAEIVDAIRDRDGRQFERVLLTVDELKTLGLGPRQTEQLTAKLSAAAQGFADLARRQTVLAAGAQWVSFGGGHPGVVPAGTDGGRQDLYVYDNAAAIVEAKGQHAQVVIGTMVRTAAGWRVIDLPRLPSDDHASNVPPGFFFQASLVRTTQPGGAGEEGGLSEAVQRLITRMESIDKELAEADAPEKQAQLNGERAEVLEKLIDQATTDDERGTWIRQLADSIGAAVQSGGFPDGVARLQKLGERVADSPRDRAQAPYVRFRYLTADYGRSVQEPQADFSKIQEKWINDLQAYIQQFPQAPTTAEAMLQLAIAQEFAGKEDEATQWYGKIVADFGTSEHAQKAAGAKRRLECVGQPITLRGTSLAGQAIDLTAYRGKTVVVHYWATWCEPCKQDLLVLKQLQMKYGRQGLTLVGVNVDNDKSAATTFLKNNPLTWPQLYEPGGLDSRLANEMGILTLPTMLLIDNTGRVVSKNVTAAELDKELGKLLK